MMMFSVCVNDTAHLLYMLPWSTKRVIRVNFFDIEMYTSSES